ncbi:restriction endonuclease subunit S [Phascolarctobacterium faecium]|nr:restriction endonuclease subunit S [Phascolarctobacterium faecium]MDM8110135.1 restriction endonuclease subunit S [Phascolarctobacterium faecium]
MKWEKVKLKEIALAIQTGPFGSQLHQSDYSKNGIPVVMPKDLLNGKISEQSIARVSKIHVNRLKRHIISNGDILYSRRGDVGRCAYATEYETGWLCGTGCLRVTINTIKANSKFIFYQLQQPSIVGWVQNHAVGSTMLNLNTAILSEIPLLLPTLCIQTKIADILSAYDELIENNQKQIKLLEEAAQRLYKEWFVDLRFPGYEKTTIIDGVPEGWKEGILGDIAINVGKKVKKEDRNKYKQYLPIDCLPRKSLAYTESLNIKLAESSLVSFKPKDILFGAMRPYFHKVVIAYDKGLTRNTCFVINAKERKILSYLTMLLFSDNTINYATTISVGTTMPYVRLNDFLNMEIIIPAPHIVKEFEKLFKPISEDIVNFAKQIGVLSEARDRLLTKLMSGEIEV